MPDQDHLYEKTGFGFATNKPNVGPLKDRFVMPPYSTLNTRDKHWQHRKRLWLAKGIQSEVGRDEHVKPTYAVAGMADYWKGAKRKDGSPKDSGTALERTSIFDPVLCELCYGWWCPPGGTVLDPFAGGSVRGIVASVLGLRYFGIELRAEQVKANRDQLGPATQGQHPPKWRQGDATKLTCKAPKVDFVFSCPPYGNLEVYSDDPEDLSNMTYQQFLRGYKSTIIQAVDRLKDNRFACFVVANYRSRDKDGKQLLDFVGDTVAAFEDAGANYYNEVILINAIGTGAMRTNNTFVRGNRKVVKMHQNVLVFCKGDPAEAAKHIPADSGVSTGGN